MSTYNSGDQYITPQYNTNTSHPLIPNSQQYIIYNKYISIHSEDRDFLKFPNSSEFDIELPEDITNIAALKLVNWTFPANYNTFSISNANVTLSFQISNPYNPAAFGLSDDYNYRIYEALFITQQDIYTLVIEDGFYNPDQIVIELTNKLNFVVTQRIIDYFTQKGWTDTIAEFKQQGGYTRFIVVYNSVSAKIWFGNRADKFIILNQIGVSISTYEQGISCVPAVKRVPNASDYGLASYLGLPRENTPSISTTSIPNLINIVEYNGISVPRFFYGDVIPGDDGYWLLPYPDLSGSEVSWVECRYKINLLGEGYMYMEIEGQNCIDETQPFNISDFTLKTNQTNGIVNASFAKLPIPTSPLSQWYDRDSIPYKLYNPPAERIRRLRIRIRYHDGRLVDFGVFNYSFMLQFEQMVPQILRSSKTVIYPPSSNR